MFTLLYISLSQISNGLHQIYIKLVEKLCSLKSSAKSESFKELIEFHNSIKE